MGAKLSAYDIVAMLPAGTVLGFGLWLIFRGDPFELLNKAKDIHDLNDGLGTLGLLVVAAFVAGELMHETARVLERFLWPHIGGWPTARHLGQLCGAKDRAGLDVPGWMERHLSSEQIFVLSKSLAARLNDAIADRMFGGRRLGANGCPFGPEQLTEVTREMYVRVCNAKRAKRIDIFNRNYGMYSGLLVTFLILFVVAVCWLSWWSLLFAIGAVICFGGIIMTGFDYAGELLLQFLALPPKDASSGSPPSVVVAIEQQTLELGP